MKRLPRWPERLDVYIEACRDVPFAWGSHDCVSFVCGAVRAITGVEIAMPARASALEALREIDRAGGMEALLSATALGRPTQNWREARRGDVALAEQEGRPVTMLCTGGLLCGPGIDRLEFADLTSARLIWRVG